MLEAGRRAPSWINLQPWHFVVLEEQARKDVLAETGVNYYLGLLGIEGPADHPE